MAGKKTLYQLLDIPMNASDATIERAHQFKLQLVEDARASLSPQDYDYRLKVLAVAKQTLLDPLARHQYDHKLMSEQGAAAPAAPRVASTPTAAGELSLAPVPANSYEQRATQADAMSLRADALHLRADALAILAASNQAPAAPSSWTKDLFGGAWAPVKRVLVFIGVLGIGWSILQFTMFSRSSSQAARMEAMHNKMSKAEERTILEDHFRTYGERPASVDEARMLAAAHHKRAAEASQAERVQQKQEKEQERALDDAQRRSEQVSRQLRDDEERARDQALREAERDRYNAENARDRADMKEQQERYRQEQKQREWQQIIRR